MKRILVLLLGVCLLCPLGAQTNRKIKDLESKRGALQEDIAQSETLLRSTKKDVKSQLSDLSLITNQIGARRKLIAQIESDVQALDNEITLQQRQLTKLQKELKEKKNKYEASVQYMYKNRSIQEKLMFIFSAKSLSQTYRRLRYVREYATYQRIQGEEVIKKQTQVEAKKKELEQVRSEKTNLLVYKEHEREKLELQEKEQRLLVTNLQKKQKSLQNEIARKRREAQRLNAQIDRLIEAEIAAAKKRAEEEARKEAAARKKSGSKGNASNSATGKTDSKAAPMEKYNLNTADRQLSGNFEKNRGLLPPPITGPYLVVSHYGAYEVTGLKHVKLDNKGIDIKGQKGAQARAIFDGEVSAIFQYNGMVNVLVRHGNYISVYCNLSSANVKRGQHVKTKDILGKVCMDSSGNTILHFQLRKETVKLNPELWLGR
mgnify:FL=1